MNSRIAFPLLVLLVLGSLTLVNSVAAVDLIADGRETAEDVGDVIVTPTVDADGNPALVVEFVVTAPWSLVCTHVAVGTVDADGNLYGIPMNRSGNPKVGKFPYEAGDIITIPPIPEGNLLVIAAHAEIEKPMLDDEGNPVYDDEGNLIMIEETAWGIANEAEGEEGGEFPGSSWASYFIYSVE
jgi:hypothetical protein